MLLHRLCIYLSWTSWGYWQPISPSCQGLAAVPIYWILFTSLVWEVNFLRVLCPVIQVIKTLNSIGCGINLRGTSLETNHHNKILTTTLYVWHSRQLFTHLVAYLASPHCSKLFLSILWDIVLMTLLKSRLTTLTALLHPQRESSHLKRLSGWSVSACYSQLILLFVFHTSLSVPWLLLSVMLSTYPKWSSSLFVSRSIRPSALIGLPITCIKEDMPSVLVLLFLTFEVISLAPLRTKESLNRVLVTYTQLQMIARHDLILKISLLCLLIFLFLFQRVNIRRVDDCSYFLSWAPSYMSLIPGLNILSYLISPFPDFFFFF